MRGKNNMADSFLARNPNIYPDLLDWLASLNDSAVNAAIRLRK